MLGTSYKWNPTILISLLLAYFINTWYSLKFHPCCSMCQNFLPFKDWLISHPVYTPQCVSCIPFIPWVDTWVSSTFGYHECCNELGYTNPSVRPWFQKLLFIIPRSRISESYDFLNFLFIYGCSGSCCCARAPLQFCRSGSSLALSSGLLSSSVERAPP